MCDRCLASSVVMHGGDQTVTQPSLCPSFSPNDVFLLCGKRPHEVSGGEQTAESDSCGKGSVILSRKLICGLYTNPVTRWVACKISRSADGAHTMTGPSPIL